MRIIGAGLSRTGTVSLRRALELLTGGRVLHTGGDPRCISRWHPLLRRSPDDWGSVVGDFVGTLDCPAALFWPEMSRAFPEAFVLLSYRDQESWWKSAEASLFAMMRGVLSQNAQSAEASMFREILQARFAWPITEVSAKAAFSRHNESVRRDCRAGRLVEWRLGDGWAPLCEALGVATPDYPFPHENYSRPA